MSANGTFFFKTAPNQTNFSAETPIRAFEPLRPYPQNPQAIIYRTRFMQLRAYYTRPAQNTPHPDLPQVYFADDADFQDRPGGVVEWTRVYATLPTSWTDFDSYAYTFPGYVGRRVPFAKTITSKLTQDYFLVGTLSNFSDLLANYDDFANASWVKSHVNTTANAAAVPACAGGDTFAAKVFVDSGINASHVIYQGSNAAPGNVAGAVFVKKSEFNTVRVGIGNPNNGSLFADVTTDLETGLPTTNSVSNYSVAAIGDGWWRIGLACNAVNANASLSVALIDNNGNSVFLGDGTSGVYLWRGQLFTGGSIPHATVPPLTTPDGTNYPVQSADLVPVKFGTCYVYNWAFNTAAEYLGGGSSPNVNTYVNYVAADVANANSYSIEATDSLLTLWQGTIWNRQRRFVKAR